MVKKRRPKNIPVSGDGGRGALTPPQHVSWSNGWAHYAVWRCCVVPWVLGWGVKGTIAEKCGTWTLLKVGEGRSWTGF